MSIIAVDPSLSCTGYAIINGDGTQIIEYGKIKPDCDGDAYDRSLSIAQHVATVIHMNIDDWTEAIVVEQPQTYCKGLGGKRSAVNAPNYGMVVGMVTMAVQQEIAKAFSRAVFLRPSASLWTRGKVGTKGDRHKTNRVRSVELQYGLPVGSLGCKADAGNIADAIMLARWGVDELERRKRNGASK